MMATSSNGEDDFKFLKLNNGGLLVGDDTKNESFTTAIKVSRTKIVIDKIFKLFLGDQSIEDFIGKVVTDSLSNWFEFDKDSGTIKIKGHVKIENDLEVDGKTSVVSEVYLGSTLTVSGEAEFQSDVKSNGNVVGYIQQSNDTAPSTT